MTLSVLFLWFLSFFSISNTEWIHSNDGTTILIGESFRGGVNYAGFFNQLTINNVSILTTNSNENIGINFYIIGANLTNKHDLNNFIEWSSMNLCTEGHFGTDNIENASFSSIMTIYYRCGFLIQSGINIKLSFDFILKYEVYLKNYNDLTWILEISLLSNTNPDNSNSFSIYIPDMIYNDYHHPHFYVNNSLSNIKLKHITNYVYNISIDCDQCHTLPNTEPSLWDFDIIDINNLNWYFIQEFYPNELNIKYLQSFHIGMYCNFEYYFVPKLLGLYESNEFTVQLLQDYINGNILWPINAYYTEPQIPRIYSYLHVQPLHYPLDINISDIDLSERDYYVWILELNVINDSFNDGYCLFQRTAGKENINYINGDSMQTVIPYQDNLFVGDYQDFYITMDGVPFPTSFPTESPSDIPSYMPTYIPIDTTYINTEQITESTELMYTTDEYEYIVSLNITIHYTGDLVTNDIHIIQDITTYLIKQNVNGIRDNYVDVSVLTDDENKIISILINIEFVNENDSNDMIEYADNDLEHDLLNALLNDNDITILVNDVDVNSIQYITPRNTNTISDDDDGFSNNNDKANDELIIIIVVVCVLICGLLIFFVIFGIKRNKYKNDKVIHIQVHSDGNPTTSVNSYNNNIDNDNNNIMMSVLPAKVTVLPLPPSRADNKENNKIKKDGDGYKETSALVKEGYNDTTTNIVNNGNNILKQQDMVADLPKSNDHDNNDIYDSGRDRKQTNSEDFYDAPQAYNNIVTPNGLK